MASANLSSWRSTGLIREVIDEACAGIPVPPGTPKHLPAILRLADDPSLAQQMGRQARIYVETHFDRGVLAAKMLNLMVGLVS
jgi:glycosyltransferase involved in cell wall biosynthesis